MKNKLTYLAVFFGLSLLATAPTALGQGRGRSNDGGDKKNIFKINMISPLVRTGSVFYERAITERSSAQLGFFYTGFSIAETRYRGFGITPEYRFYLSQSKSAPQGFFVAPYARYQNVELSLTVNEVERARLTGFGGGVVVGGQWIFSDIVSLDVFAGPSFTARNISYEGGAIEQDFNFTGFSNVGLRFGVTLGLAF
ncbi:MAG: DUF3575 domain-containing protein [Bernardetiaceae bacterium]|jgi:hypothetical protein|nr:DUF3575 domain-containing protein [Bernardetiaceae bacterium]